MSIDASALTSIKNAISSSSNQQTYSTSKSENVDYLSSITKAAAGISTESRYKAAFEEKMKIANGSDDTVEISDKSLQALKKYQQNQLSTDDSKETSSSSGYTYDYQAIKKKNLENQAQIEKEVAEKYGKKTTTESDATETTEKVATDKTEAAKTDTVASTTTTTDTTKTASSTDTTKTEESTKTYGYDYTSMKAQDDAQAAQIEKEVAAKYGKKDEAPVENALS
jgi:hypothetical protein